jgi:peptidoglycan/xylan/chitin deacetylase (PgdA/CDA1 family)
MSPVGRIAAGMDHHLYSWSPLPTRKPLQWPEGAALAVVIMLCLESVEWEPQGADAPPSARGAVYPRAYDPTLLSLHEYGNRVGAFRVLDVLDRLGLPATAAVDALVAERRAPLVEECSSRVFSFAGRGASASQMTTEQVSEADERSQIERCLQALAQITGSVPRGWLGVGYGESSRTLTLLAESGIRYVCDWPNDEQPYIMRTSTGRLVSLPVAVELDDVMAMRLRSLPVQEWEAMVGRAAERLRADGADSGRLLVLALHPYLVGQPFRIRSLERTLASLAAADGVRFATADEVCDWYERSTLGA